MAAIKGLNFKISATASGVGAITSFTRAISGVSVAGKQARDALGNWQSMIGSLRGEFNPMAAEVDRLQETMKRLTLAQQMGVVSVESYTTQMQQLEQELKRVGTAQNTLIPVNGRWNRGLTETKRAVQQASFQVNDFFIQVAGGQNIILAFTQQAGQLVQFFGAWGAAAGAALAVGGALFLMFGDVKTAVEKLKSANEALSASIAGLSAIGDMSLEDLRKKYGTVDTALLELIQHQRDYDLLLLNNAAASAIGAAYGEFSTRLESIKNQSRDGTVAMQALKSELGFSSQEVQDFARAFESAMAAVTIEDKAAAFGVLDGFLSRSKIAGSELANEIRKTALGLREATVAAESSAGAVGKIRDAAGGIAAQFQGVSAWAQMANANIKGSADEAVRLANTNMAAGIAAAANWAQALWGRLSGAAAQARAIASLDNKRLGDLNAGMMGRAGAPGQGSSRNYGLDAWTSSVSTGTGGGGGGGAAESPIAKLAKDYADLTKSIDPAVTSTRVFADAAKIMNDALANGTPEAIQAAFDRVKPIMEDLQKSFTDLTKSISSSMMSAFSAVVKRTESLADGVKSVLNTIIDKMIEMLMSPIFDGIAGFLGKSIFGAIGGLGAVPTFAGGGGTGNGPRSGGLDGQGGFLAVMHPKESVTDHTRGGGRNGGGVTINVIVNGATGNNEIMQMVSRGVEQGLKVYDAKVLPSSVKRVSQNPRRNA